VTLIARYLAGQLMRPIVAIVIAALLALLAERTLRIVDLVIGWRGSLFVIVEMIGYLVPHYMGLALPAALFIAILLTIGRLARDGELDAIMASGAGFGSLVRPLLFLAVLFAGLNLVIQSHLQPWSRYAYRAAVHALTDAGFQALLREGRFATLGSTTYMVETIAPDRASFSGLFLASERDGGAMVAITAEQGRVVASVAIGPVALQLQNGVQQYVPAADPATGRPTGPATTLRFRAFTSDLSGNAPGAMLPRGEDERELTLPELLATPDGVKERGIDPAEVAAELHVRLIRVLATVTLPLVALPLAIARRRARRSWGFLVGVAILIAFNQVLQLGKTLVDDGKVGPFLAMWLPFTGFVVLGVVLCVARFRRVPSGDDQTRLERWLERRIDRLRRLLPEAEGTA